MGVTRMDLPGPPDVQRITLDALVTYSDACTLPKLTPSCPYYREDQGRATCGEECRELIQRLGIEGRRIRETQIDGLVMKGREVPKSAATGAYSFDASERYIEERQRAVGKQGTGSLLLGLRSEMMAFPFDGRPLVNERVLSLWSELQRRGVPVERVVSAQILPDVAWRVALMATVPAQTAAGIFLEQAVSTDLVSKLELAASEGWADVLDAAVSSHGDDASAIQAAFHAVHPNEIREIMQQIALPVDMPSPPIPADYLKMALSDARIPYAVSPLFRRRVEDWLRRLLTEDISALLVWQAPPPVLFLALPSIYRPADELGTWIWERFTKTRLDEWSTASLLKEWECIQTGELPISQRVWAERTTDEAEVAHQALTKSSQRLSRRTDSVEAGLDPSGFIAAAVQKLQAGRTRDAADIFAGLVELRPADGDALNNLGFCLIPLDLHKALEALQQASLYPRNQILVSSANRVLALHLLGRDKDALELGRDALSRDPDPENDAYLWIHNDESPAMLLGSGNVRRYLQDLLLHIQEATVERP